MTPKESNAIPVLSPFNPLDKLNLGKSVLGAMMERPLVPVSPLKPFEGAGVYAVYYVGLKPLYEDLEAVFADDERPIYVGKAVPVGARKGNAGVENRPGLALFKRLKEHAESIDAVDNLEMRDFKTRFLAVDDIWIPLAETLLITKRAPLWNVVIEGFGNHDPGKGRANQQKSVWDALHPGRNWAFGLRDNPTPREELKERIQRWKGA